MPDLASQHHETTTRNISATSDVVPRENRHVAKTRLTIANLAAQPDNSHDGQSTNRINVLV